MVSLARRKLTDEEKEIRLKHLKCKECEHLHCDYYESYYGKECESLEIKLDNPYRKLQNYVYLHLKKYGNSLIANTTYTLLGEKEIIKDLKKNGFKKVKIEKGAFGSIIAFNLEEITR